MTELIIIGAGPAGATAAVYAKRAGLDFFIFEKGTVGGQTALSSEIENFPSIEKIDGYEFAYNLQKQMKALQIKPISAEVKHIEKTNDGFCIKTNKEEYTCKSVIIANGVKRRKLGCKGEAEFTGRGVSYCATCDGAFFRGKEVCVIGGGNTALEDAIYLAKLCKTVNIIVRKDSFRGERGLVDALKKFDNVNILYNTVVTEIVGDGKVNSVNLLNTAENSETKLETNGVFVAIGMESDNAVFSNLVEIDKYGYIVADEDCKTSCDGIFAVGDTRKKEVRQIVTACSDGAVAIHHLMHN